MFIRHLLPAKVFFNFQFQAQPTSLHHRDFCKLQPFSHISKMSTRNIDMEARVEACCRTSEDFTQLYYACLDNRRHLMVRLYIDSANLTWNGTGQHGREDIGKFLLSLPSSDHQVITLDTQPILEPSVSTQTTYIILATGTVNYLGFPLRNFQQSFVITSENGNWKIASDYYRLQDLLF